MKMLLISLMLLISVCLFADHPGNKPRPDTWVRISGVKNLPNDWILYKQSGRDINKSFDDGTIMISGDTLLLIGGGRGRPDHLRIWAQNSKTSKKTPVLYYYTSNDSPIVSILTIRNDSLILQPAKTKNPSKSNKNEAGFFSSSGKSNTPDNPTGLLIGIAVMSLSLLGWVYYRNRQPKSNFN